MAIRAMILIIFVVIVQIAVEAPKTPKGDFKKPRDRPNPFETLKPTQKPPQPHSSGYPESQTCGHLVFSMVRWHVVSDNILARDHPFRAHFVCNEKCEETFRKFKDLAGRGFSGFSIDRHAKKFTALGDINFVGDYRWSDVCQASGRICYAWQTVYPYSLDGRPAQRYPANCLPRTADCASESPVFAGYGVGCACEVKLQLLNVLEGEVVEIPGDPLRVVGRTHTCSMAAICKRLEKRYPKWSCLLDRSESISSGSTCPPVLPLGHIFSDSSNKDSCPCNLGGRSKKCQTRADYSQDVQESTPLPQLDPLVGRARGKQPMSDSDGPSSIPRKDPQLPTTWSQMASTESTKRPLLLAPAGVWIPRGPQRPLVHQTPRPPVDLTQTPNIDLTGPVLQAEGQLSPLRTSSTPKYRRIEVQPVHGSQQDFQLAPLKEAQAVASQSSLPSQSQVLSQTPGPNEWQYFDQSAEFQHQPQRLDPGLAIDQDPENYYASGARSARRIGQGSQAWRSSRGGLPQGPGQSDVHLPISRPGQTEVAGSQPGVTGPQDASIGSELPSGSRLQPSQDLSDYNDLASILPFY